MIILFVFFIYGSKYIIDKPIVDYYNTQQANTHIKISGQLARDFITHSLEKKTILSDCHVEVAIENFTISLKRAYCFPSFTEYIFNANKYFHFGRNFNNTIKIFGKTFVYILKNNKIIIRNANIRQYNKNIIFFFCAKPNENILKHIPFITKSAYYTFFLQYLLKLKKLCILLMQDGFNIVLMMNSKTTKDIFSYIIKIYKDYNDLKLEKIRDNLFFINLLPELGKLVFLEYVDNLIIIRFATTLKNTNFIRRFIKLPLTYRHNYVVYINNISFEEFVNYLSIIFKINKQNFKINQYIITINIRW